MVRQDYEEADFDRLYAHIDEIGIALPLISVLTPLPGTQLYHARRGELLTEDRRFFDLLHSVLPTRMPRAAFYRKLSSANQATWAGWERANWDLLRNRPDFVLRSLPSLVRFLQRAGLRACAGSPSRPPGARCRFWSGVQDKIVRWRQPENVHLRSQARPGGSSDIGELTLDAWKRKIERAGVVSSRG